MADHEVPEHVNPAHHFSAFVYCFGGLTFFVTVIQILSGMFLTMYYVPDIKNAWESVYYLQNEVAFGQIVREISITNIRILETREDIYGVLRLSFQTEEDRKRARACLHQHQYQTFIS